MYGSEHIPLHHLLGEHDGILVVVTLPRHERNLEVPSESKLAVLGGVAFGKYLTGLDPVTLSYYRLEGDSSALVGPAVDRKLVCGLLRGEADEFLILAAVVPDADLVGVNIGDFAGAFGDDLGTGVDAGPLLKSGTHDRGLWPQKRNGLTHHVRTHQCTVGIVVLKERNAGSSHRSHLVRGYVHIIHLLLGNDREVGLKTALDAVFEYVAFLVHLHVCEGYELVLLLFCTHIVAAGIAEIDLAVLHIAVRGLNETEVVNACIYAKG